MKKIFGIFLALVLTFTVAGKVHAQEGDLGFIPDPESGVFGLQMAWMRITENWQRITTVDEEKLTELELRIAEREQVLLERINDLFERNPEVAERLEDRVKDLQEKNEERLNYIGTRVDKIRIKREAFEGYESSWANHMEERREYLLEQREELQELYKVHQEERELERSRKGGN